MKRRNPRPSFISSVLQRLVLVLILIVVLAASRCGGGSASSSTSPPPPPTSTCAAPASANPTGGGGVYSQISIDPNVYGTGDVSNLTVFGFSQESMNLPADPQVLELDPNIVSRAWQRWDLGGTQSSDYNWSYPTQAQAENIDFIGGTTATVLFQDEFPQTAQFNSVVSCNAQGQPVVHAPLNFYRGSMASPTYRNYIIGIGELQIDGGVNGLFFDEPDESYEGATYGNGDEGFDDADIADFGGFLCAKYPTLSASGWQSQFGIIASDNLNCSASTASSGRSFNYRGLLARNNWGTDPLNPSNPLAAEWGTMLGGHPEPQNGTFTGTYTSLVYWQNIVLTLRTYARQTYGKEILITANGVWPFVDFQMNGLWDGNPDGPGGSSVDYCPLTLSGDLDGTQSLLAAFLSVKQRSARIDGLTVPVAVFIDWPTGVMTRYLSLPSLSEKQDYWRMYAAEAAAATVYFNFHLLDTIGDPTATQLGLMPLFESLNSFYQAHAALYHGTQDLSGGITVSVPNVATNLTQLGNGSTVAHLINHNYNQGFQEQDGVTVSFPMAKAPATVTLASPDYSADMPVSFTYSAGQVQVTVPQLIAYVAVVAD
jgi:hypothetical protein